MARIVSWNVNGLRAAHRKGFLTWLTGSGAEIVGLQEVRARVEQLPDEVRAPAGWSASIVAGVRPGYSGVAIYARRAPDRVEHALGVRAFDDEGRVILTRFGELTVASVYFPKGSGTARDNSRVPYKLRFYRQVFSHLQGALGRERVLVMGDFNTAHQEIDLARPRQNRENSGFLPEERRELGRWLAAGWVDTFRHFEPASGHYTWWSQRGGLRERNVGWRIDYILASPAAMPFVRAAAIHPDVRGSDHCPVSVDVDPAIFGAARPGARRGALGARSSRT